MRTPHMPWRRFPKIGTCVRDSVRTAKIIVTVCLGQRDGDGNTSVAVSVCFDKSGNPAMVTVAVCVMLRTWISIVVAYVGAATKRHATRMRRCVLSSPILTSHRGV